MNPKSAKWAGAEAETLARKQFSGLSAETKRRRVAKANAIAQAIWNRWRVGIYRYRLKHVRWYVTCALSAYTQNTRYQYWLSLRSLLVIVGKESWLNSLQGPWTRPCEATGSRYKAR